MRVEDMKELQSISAAKTPFYLYDFDHIEKNVRAFCGSFSASDVSLYYSMKTNDYEPLLYLLKERELRCEVESQRELRIARKVGFSEIFFNGVAKTDDELLEAIKSNDCIISIDNLSELSSLQRLATSNTRVAIRLNCSQSRMYKFGMRKEDFCKAVRLIHEAKYLALVGFHFHVGSFVGDVTIFKRVFQQLMEYVSCVPQEELQEVSFVNMGGGFPCERKTKRSRLERLGDLHMFKYGFINAWLQRREKEKKYKEKQYCTTSYSKVLSEVINECLSSARKTFGNKAQIFLEPGTILVGDAVDLYAHIVRVKNNFLFMNVSRFIEHGNAVYDHHIFNHTRPSEECRDALLFGPLGTDNDLFGRTYQGDVLKEGDLVRVASMGAYTYSTRKAFVMSQPAVVVKKGKRIYFDEETSMKETEL